MCWKMLILVFFGLLSRTHGGPQLSSSTSSLELSGEVFPGYITLTCSKNTTEKIFVWYINDNELARFDEDNMTPFTIRTSLDLFNVTVQVTSVVEVNGYYSFDNFTLTARVSDFLPLQGQNLTCGTLLDRSERFRIGNFSLSLPDTLPANINVSYSAIYSKSYGILNEVNLHWTNVKYQLKCSIEVYYIIKWVFTSSNTIGDVTEYELNCTTEVCTFTLYTQDASPSHEDSLEVSVTVKETTLNYSTTISTSASEVVGGYSEMECGIYIECTSATVDGCTLQIGQNQDYDNFTESIIISVNSSYNWNFSDSSQGVYFFQLTSKYNGARSDLRFNISAGNSPKSEDDTLLFIIGWSALIVGIILNVCGYIITGIYWKDFGSSGKMIAVGFLILSIILWVLSLSLLISYHATYTKDSCGTKVRNLSIVISAACISLLYCAYSACLTGAICIFPKIDMLSRRSSRDEMKLKFGKNIRILSNNKRCIDCNEEFALMLREELCQSCSKYMCKDCGGISEAFIPRNMKMGIICRSCNREYREENKKLIMKANSVAKLAKLQSKVANGACCVCNELKEVKYKCSCCSQNICKNHSKKLPKEVTKEFSIDDSNYCHFCYEIYMRKYDSNIKLQTETKATSL